MAVSGEVADGLAVKYASMRTVLGEGQWRWYLGTEALALGRGGIAVVARAAGVSPELVSAGAAEVTAGEARPGPGRQRRPGGGRKKAEQAQDGLREALLEIAEEATRGDPMAAVTWCSKSLRQVAGQVRERGFACGKDTAARVLRANGYRLQAMSKVLEGKQHPDRDAQFRHLNARMAEFRAAGDPVVSVDAKKKELIGPYGRDGRSWRPQGSPVKVRDHDFPDRELGKAVPYGACDVAANRGFVSVGASGDTAAFAVNALRLWHRAEGASRYPGARRLLVVCDAGGSNSARCALWKDQLAELAAETGLEVTVCHFPPGTSKWNKIEHRLFCHVTRAWSARPLMTMEDAVAGIAATVTAQGLKCTAVLDEADYPTKVRVPGARARYLDERVLDRDAFHGEWNYTVLPAPRPAPEPEPAPEPGPDLQGLAALAGISDLPALLGDLAAPFAAAREQRLYLDRGRSRLRATGGAEKKLPYDAIVAAAACRQRLRVPYRVLAEFLGVHQDTVSLTVTRAVPLLEQHGITRNPGGPRIKTLTELQDHALSAGITLTIHAPETTRRELITDVPITLKSLHGQTIFRYPDAGCPYLPSHSHQAHRLPLGSVTLP